MKGKRIKRITIHFLLFITIFSILAPIQTILANPDTVVLTFNPLGNDPPFKPTNPNPSPGDTDVPVPVILSVDVYDDTETFVDVFFYNASSGALIDVDMGVSSNWGTATVVWNEPIKGLICFWYAIARDPEGLTTQSDTWIFATRPNQAPIIDNNEYPQNESKNIPVNVTCRITVSDEDADDMTIFWYENSTGSWIERQRNTSVPNGTYYWTFQESTDYYRTYYWKVAVNSTYHNTTAIFHFRTRDNQPLVLSDPIPENRSTEISYVTNYWYITIEDPENDTFNYTIETSPDVGNTSLNNELNGQKACPLSGMVANTTYTVYVNASDYGNGTLVKETFWFKTTIQGAPSIANEYPPDKNTHIDLKPICHIDVFDNEGDNLTVLWYDNAAGSWILRQNDSNVSANSTVYWKYSLAVSYSTTYYWMVIVDDGMYNATGVYFFTTKPKPSGDTGPSGGDIYVPPVNEHPIANITGQFLGYVDETLIFSGENSFDPDGFIIEYRWDFNNDGKYDTDWSEDMVISYSWPESGNYTIRLQVKDNYNAITTSDPVVIHIVVLPDIKQLPIANIEGSYSGNINDKISFSSNGSFDPDGIIVNYTWNFDDGSISYLENPTHKYSEPGSYVVVLTVRDNDNLTNSTIVSNVIIIDPDSESKDKEKEEQPFLILLLIILAIIITIMMMFIRSKTYRFTFLIKRINKPSNPNKKKIDLDVIVEKLPKKGTNGSEKRVNITHPKSDAKKEKDIHSKVDNLIKK